MPADRKEYMRKFMADKRAKAKAAQQESKGLVEPAASPQAAPQVPIAAKPARLVIVADDCAACGHDRSYYHSAAGCSHPYTAGAPQSGVAGSPCVCSAFVDPSSPF